MIRDFEQELMLCRQVVVIDLDPDTLEKIDATTKEIIDAKKDEAHHKADPFHDYLRFHTGLMGECAVEKYLGHSFVDWEIGNSNDFNQADLSALNLDIGVKTVEYGKFHIVHKTPVRPEILCVKEDDSRVLILGIASIRTLSTYQDDELILSPFLRGRGTKTGFYGYDHLQPFRNLFDLEGPVIRFKEHILDLKGVS